MSVLKTIGRAVELCILDFDARAGAKGLRRQFPDFRRYGAFTQCSCAKLRPIYDKYVAEVSSPGMAISWEASCFIYVLAQLKRPKTILDLGSGFSSYVFRSYSMSAEHDVLVFSVDDNDCWLGRTKAFLENKGVDSAHLMPWRVFQEQPRLSFDLVFHDLGSMTLRSESLPLAIASLGRGGALILDDMHKRAYRSAAVRDVSEAGLSLFSARRYTLDRHGRFSALAIPCAS